MLALMIVNRFERIFCNRAEYGKAVRLMFVLLPTAGGRCGSYHGGPCGAFKRGVALVSYLIEHSNGLTRWTFVDMTVRLRRLAKVHATEGAEDTIDGDVVTDT